MVQHRSRYFLVGEILGTSIVSVTRTKTPFDTVEEMQAELDELNRVLDTVKRGEHRLLIDTRDAPARNDAEFEQAFAPYRARMLRGFEKRAVVVRSTAGKLQVQRHAREDGIETGAFTDAREALSWLEH